MAQTQQTFVNRKDDPIYVSVEPWPQCFELKPGDRLTLIWDGPATGDTVETEFVNERELVVHPYGDIDGIRYLINGQPALELSWRFKHR
jgi:hypothetical protein